MFKSKSLQRMLRAMEVPVLALLVVVEIATEAVAVLATGAVEVVVAKLPLPESDDLGGRSWISNGGGGGGGDMFVNGTSYDRGCGGGMERCIKDNRSSLLSSI